MPTQHQTASSRSVSRGPPERRPTKTVRVGSVSVGSDHPIVVQSMTNTDTADIEATATQVEALWRAGSEIVRITVNTSAAAQAVPRIAETLEARDVDVPLVGMIPQKAVEDVAFTGDHGPRS